MHIGQYIRKFTVIPQPNSEESYEQDSQSEKEKQLPEKLDERVKVE